MQIAVVGAAGRTGRHVVEQALARGHQVTALVRTPEAITIRDANLVVSRADVLDVDSLVDSVGGSDALVSTLGIGTSRAATDVYSRGVANELAAMAANGIRKLVVIAAAPAGPRADQPFFERRVAMPLLERLFGGTYDDMRRMETTLRNSDISWISLRPPRLIEKAGTGAYRIDTRPLPRARTLTYPDLATALLDSIAREDLYKQAVYVAN